MKGSWLRSQLQGQPDFVDGRARDGKLQGLRAAGRREVAAEAAEQ